MNHLEPPTQSPNSHGNFLPPKIKTVQGPGKEIIYYDLSSGNAKYFKAARVKKVYNNTQCPPPLPELSPRVIRERREKRKCVEKEAKKVAEEVEERIKDISNIYRISVPTISDDLSHKSSTLTKSEDHNGLPDIYENRRHSKHLCHQKHGEYRRSLFRATMEDRQRNSQSYQEFVGKLSYLINQSPAKITECNENSFHAVIYEFLGKSPLNNYRNVPTSSADNMKAFRQTQFSIGNALRKLLDTEQQKFAR